MRINLGCGDWYAPGWHNVDHEGSPFKRDDTVDLTQPLPWSPGTVTHVYAGHILEHLTVEQAALLLSRLLACMAPSGVILVVGPDVEVARAIGTGPYHTMEQLVHGGQRWPGDEHVWECTAEAVVDLLTDAGWAEVMDVGIENVPSGWPVVDRVPQWQLAVCATVPPSVGNG